jgi:hypothetical protein
LLINLSRLHFLSSVENKESRTSQLIIQIKVLPMIEQDDLEVIGRARAGHRFGADENVALMRVGVEESVQVDLLGEDLQQRRGCPSACLTLRKTRRRQDSNRELTLESSFETKFRSILCLSRYSWLSTRAPSMTTEIPSAAETAGSAPAPTAKDDGAMS